MSRFFLLLLAHRFTREFGAIQVGVRGHAAQPGQQLRQGFARFDLINPGRGDFAFDTHQAGLAVLRYSQVLLGQDGDDVSGLQRQVVLGIAVVHGARQVEGDQARGEGGAVEAFDHGVVPVDFVEQVADAPLHCDGVDFVGFLKLHQQILALVVIGGD